MFKIITILLSFSIISNADEVNKIESSILFNNPIIGGYNYNVDLYIADKENVIRNESIGINLLNEKNAKLILNLTNGTNNLVLNSDLYLTKISWLNKIESNSMTKTLNYEKNPSSIIFNGQNGIKNEKSCFSFNYKITIISALSKFKDENNNETLSLFSTYERNGTFECINITQKKYIIIDSVNKTNYEKSIDHNLSKLNNQYNEKKDSYLLLKINKI